jgi:hypothetical protein
VPLTILVLRDTCGGRLHDKRMAAATPSPLPVGSRLWQELGLLVCTLPEVAIRMPMKQPRGEARTLEEKLATQALHARR